MMTLPQLKALAKQNNINSIYCKNKEEIAKLLLDKKNIITFSGLINQKIVVEPVKRDFHDMESNYENLKGITACTVVQAVVKVNSQSNGKGQILTPWGLSLIHISEPTRPY